MATAAANDVVEPVVAGVILLLDPNEIEIPARLREIDMPWAEGIGQSMKRDGQIHPIHVCAKPQGGWMLAGPGGHRTIGARRAGIPIEAKEVSANAAGQLRREAAENVFRRPNTPLERAAAVAELVRLHREKAGIVEANRRSASVPAAHARAIREEAGTTLETISNVYGFTKEVAAELGFSDRTIRNDLLLYRGIAPSLVARLRERRHPIEANAAQLKALARLEPAVQQQVVNLLTDPQSDTPKLSTVSAALSLIKGSNFVADPEAKRLSAFIGAWSRMGLAEKKAAARELAALLPAGITLTFDGGKE